MDADKRGYRNVATLARAWSQTLIHFLALIHLLAKVATDWRLKWAHEKSLTW